MGTVAQKTPSAGEPSTSEARAMIEAAALPPVAAESGMRLLEVAKFDLTSALGETSSPREWLADAYRQIAHGLRDPDRHTYEVVLTSIAAATLAEAHGLAREPGHEPCARALELVGHLRSEWRQVLRPRVLRLLDQVVDGVALERGKGDFVGEVRALLSRADRWRPTVLDVGADAQIRFGSVPAAYRDSRTSEDGERTVKLIPLGLGNAEGRLVLLAADGRAPTKVDPSVFSRASTAVRLASRGAVELVRGSWGRPMLQPFVELTRNARGAAQSVRSLRSARKRKRCRS